MCPTTPPSLPKGNAACNHRTGQGVLVLGKPAPFAGEDAQRNQTKVIAVGTAVAGGPPRRSVREALPHTAPALSLARNRLSG